MLSEPPLDPQTDLIACPLDRTRLGRASGQTTPTAVHREASALRARLEVALGRGGAFSREAVQGIAIELMRFALIATATAIMPGSMVSGKLSGQNA